MTDQVQDVQQPTQPTEQVQQPAPQPVQQPVLTKETQPTPVQANQETDPDSLIGSNPLETSINMFSHSTGISPDSFVNAVQAAVQYGDDNLIDVTSLTQGLTDPVAKAQAIALAKATYQHIQAEQGRVQSTAHQLAGGEAQWTAALEAFNTHADTRTRGYAKYLESEGDIEGAVQHIMQTVQNLGVVNSQQGEFVTPSGCTPAQMQALSYAEYNAAIRELQREAGNAMTNPRSPHYQKFVQLQNAREQGKRLGR